MLGWQKNLTEIIDIAVYLCYIHDVSPGKRWINEFYETLLSPILQKIQCFVFIFTSNSGYLIMAYRDFSLNSVKKIFGLIEKPIDLFPDIAQLEASSWLKETLATSIKLALSSSSEKARSEFIVAPILLELEKRNTDELSIFSGERLDIDEEKGLKGKCDFIFSKGPLSLTIQAPIFSLVEAKRNDIKEGLGQCIAQMLGASIFNQKEDNFIEFIYGCVTTGEDWQFLKLENNFILTDTKRYYLSELDKVLWILQSIVDTYKAQSKKSL